MNDQAPGTKAVAAIVHPRAERRRQLEDMAALAGLSARVFGSAEDALASLASAPPDLIVTGLRMPGIDGWRFCRLLRSPEYASLNRAPIVLLSETYAEEEAHRIGGDLGVDAFLPWPVPRDRFVSTAKTLLRGEPVRPPLHALVVEDDEGLCGLLERSLSRQHYRVTMTGSAHDASAAVDGDTFDIAIIDYHLPDRGGDELLDLLGTRQPDCACIMVTGDMAPELAVDWMRRGASAYLRKPFQPQYLLELCARARRERALIRAERMLDERTRALRVSETKCRDIIDQAAEMIFIHDQDGRFLDANHAGCRQLGYTYDELMSLRVFDIDPDAETRSDREQFWFADWPAEKPILFRTRHRRKDGSVYPAEMSVTPIRTGEEICILAMGRDISEQLRAEEEYREQIEELQRWHHATMGRENRIIELKREVNEALERLGEPPRYSSPDEN